MARHALNARLEARALNSTPSHVAPVRRDGAVEGTGDAGGIVLPMQLVGDGLPEIAYTVTLNVGRARTPYSILVDSGSSDLWLASSQCSSSACSAAHSQLYDASSAISTDKFAEIDYLVGSVEGSIVWDRVELGGYPINTQALIAATSVESEPLSIGFTGLLGLALESGSSISRQLPSVKGNAPDGAPFWSNVFGAFTDVHRFFSVSLSRPGFDTIPSLLGIGMHPSSLVQDASKIHFYDVVPGEAASTYWRVQLRAVTAYVNGIAAPINLGRSIAVPDVANPVAVFDTGAPLILVSVNLANAIYGAYGISPPLDGNGFYYMPCDQMLNISITIGAIEFPIHPLDVAYNSDPSSKYCTGSIRSSNDLTQGDLILGVPFLRNAYTVFQYSSEIGTNSDEDQAFPQFGLLSLTDPATAISEWRSVRLDHVPLTQPAPGGSSFTGNHPGKKLSVGIEVLLGLIGFFALCGILFIGRWFLLRRKHASNNKASTTQEAYPHDSDLARALAGAERYSAIRSSRYSDPNATHSTRYSEPSDILTLHTLRHDDKQDRLDSGKGSFVDEPGDRLTPRSSRRSASLGRYSSHSENAVSPSHRSRNQSTTSPEREHQWRAPDDWRHSANVQLVDIHPTEVTGHTPDASLDSPGQWRISSVEEPKTPASDDPLLPASPTWPSQETHAESVDMMPRHFAGVGTFASAQSRRLSTARANSFTATPAVMSPLHTQWPLVAASDTDEALTSSHEHS